MEKIIDMDEWQKIKSAVMKRNRDRCFYCGSEKGLDVILSNQRKDINLTKHELHDFITVCENCIIRMYDKEIKK